MFGPLLQLLARSSPWITLVSVVIGGTYIAWRELRRNTWHFTEQCAQRMADMEKRLLEKDRVNELLWERNGRLMHVADNSTETAVRSAALVELATGALAPVAPDAKAD